ncbi:MAG: AI-2E family transporter YdiK, partial [Rubrivivax sp.]|nr:AI-2E family transporter YdiK [Rubrivivax sp.]
MIPSAGRDLARTTFAVLFIGALLAVSLWILRPFLAPVVWATMVVVATWPLLLRVEALLWRRRALAVSAMTLLLLLLFVVPLTLAIVTIVGNADRLVAWAKFAAEYRLPDDPPAWIANLPLVGGTLVRLWEEGTSLGLRDLLTRLTPY